MLTAVFIVHFRTNLLLARKCLSTLYNQRSLNLRDSCILSCV